MAESTSPVSLTIRRTEVVPDAGGGTHVFLVPDEGRVEIEALHGRLYAGVLRPHLRTDIPYVPHVTIGAAPDLSCGEQLAKELSLGSRVVRGTVLGMELVDVGQAVVRTVITYRFGGTRHRLPSPV